GGAMLLVTGTSDNNYVNVYNTNVIGTGGVSTQYRPSTVFTVVTVLSGDHPSFLMNQVLRCGFMDSISDPPLNGIYMEANPAAVDGFWTCVCRRAGTQTRVTTVFDYTPGHAFVFRIEVLPGVAVFYGSRYDASGNFNWRRLAQITTFVPLTTTLMSLN